jgi:CitB family two-component system response regulator MalR
MTNVLLICRDKELRNLIKKALADLPVHITKECDSAKGVSEAMIANRADLVILDLFLPGASGLEVMKILKKLNEHAEFVLITRLRTRTAIDRAFRNGALDVLVYPFALDTLKQTVAHRLELRVKPGTTL